MQNVLRQMVLKKASPILADLSKWLKYIYGSCQTDDSKRKIFEQFSEWMYFRSCFFLYHIWQIIRWACLFLTWQIKQLPAEEGELHSSLEPLSDIFKTGKKKKNKPIVFLHTKWRQEILSSKKKTTLGRDVIKQSLCIVIHVRNRSLKYRNQYSPFTLKHFF